MITRIAVSIGGTINLGNYENVKVEYVIETAFPMGNEKFEETIIYLEERLTEKFVKFKENIDKNLNSS